jgi:hypothetical protein
MIPPCDVDVQFLPDPVEGKGSTTLCSPDSNSVYLSRLHLLIPI